MDERDKYFRSQALTWMALISFGVLAATLFSMQVWQHESYAQAARANRQFTRRVLAPRGIISDRHGVNLAHNVYQARITYPRRLATAEDSTLTRLIDLLDLDRDFVFERIENAAPGDRVTIVRRATPRELAIVEEHRVLLPDVQAVVQPRRHYRFGSLAAHVIGYVGEVRRDEMGAGSVYLSGDVRGRTGVESFAEDQLRGIHGREVVEVNAAGHVVGIVEEGTQAPVPGVHLYLTIDQQLQARLEELLADHTGAGVVIEVATGDILAAASAPTYDPNEFTGGISQARLDEVRKDPRKPEFNRALRGTYPPGSPFKLITAAAALDRGYVRPSTRFEPCYGGYAYGDRFFGCWNPAGHGSLDLEGAIVQSCDTYFYQLAQLLTVDELAETARRFGFGSPSGLDAIRDHGGLVPTKEWYDERLGPRGWTSGVKLNLAIGQGELLVTPLQLARSFAALGGDGRLRKPHLVLAREYASGAYENRLVVAEEELVCRKETQRFLKRAMRQVVRHEEGTGGLAQVGEIAVAGKTGTAENPFGEDHAWFVAYAPADDPEVAVALIVENAGHGGDVAAPLVGQLLDTYFTLTRQPRHSEVGR